MTNFSTKSRAQGCNKVMVEHQPALYLIMLYLPTFFLKHTCMAIPFSGQDVVEWGR